MGERLMYECTECPAFTLNAPRGNGPILCPDCYWDSMGEVEEYYDLIPSTTTQNGG